LSARLHSASLLSVATFVGRTTELSTLLESARTGLKDGGPSAALIFGDPGSGKSRLLSEASLRAPARHRLPIVGYEPERQIPLSASMDLLRELSQVPNKGPLLTSLLFEDRRPQGALDPMRVFEGARRCLETLDGVLITIDDLQWVDDLSLALCHYLLRGGRESSASLAMLAASREAIGSRRFESSLAQILGSPARLTSLELGPLPRADGVLLSRELSPALSEEEAGDVWERAKGSPFWLEVLAVGGPGTDAGRLVTDRLRGSDEDGISLLALLSVAGRPLPLAEAGGLLGWPIARLQRAAAALATSGIAVSSPGSLMVAHDLIREAALANLPERQRVPLHQRIATYLENHATADDVVALAEALGHRRAGRLPSLDLALRLARSQRRRLLGSGRLHQLAAIAAEADRTDRRSLELHREVAALASELGETALALERWDLLSRRSETATERAQAGLQASMLAWRLGRADEAREHVRRIRAQGSLDPGLAIEVDAWEALLLRFTEQRRVDAHAMADRALQAARSLARKAGGIDKLDPASRRGYFGAVTRAFDWARIDEDDPLQMIQSADEMIAASADEEEHLHAMFNAGLARRPLGRWVEAESCFRSAWTESEDLLLPRWTTEVGYWFADALRVLGRWGEAEEVATHTIRVARRLDEARGQSDCEWVLNLIDLSRRDWQRGIARFEEELAAEPDPHYRVPTHQVTASWLARLLGREGASGVTAHLSAGFDDALTAGCKRCRLEFTIHAAESYARVGHLQDARRVLTSWEDEVPDPAPVASLWLLRSRATIAVESGATSEGIHLLEAALEAAEHMQMRADALWVRLDLGAALASDERDRAARFLRDAASQADELGAATERRVAEQWMRSLGVRPWRRGRTARGEHVLDRLSSREKEIARLVAAGSSNPEIARTLFVSRKTVEIHVSNVLAKLELRNRTELASRFGALLSTSLSAAPEERGPSRQK
jgi:DNA-binding CsgD family transcriptional regulator